MLLRDGVNNQYYSVICANIASFSYGIGLGWLSPSLPLLLSDNSPISTGPITLVESSWIASIFCIGLTVGSVFFSWMPDLIGRKWAILALGLPEIIGFLLTSFAPNVNYLYVARLLAGMSGGGILVLIPLYITEISDDSKRGVLGMMFSISANLGTLMGYIIGHFLDFSMGPFVGIAFTALFMLTFSCFPETAHHLLANKKLKKAEKSIGFYKTVKNMDKNKLVSSELSKIQNEIEKSKSNQNKITFEDLSVPSTRKGILVGAVSLAMCQFGGTFAITNYTAIIFYEAGSSLHPNYCAMIIAFIQIVASYISYLLIDRIGRKVLLVFSAAGTGISHTAMGVYFYLQFIGVDLSHVAWIPLVCLSAVMFIAAMGVTCLGFIITVELVPPKLRSKIPGFSIGLLGPLGFIFLKYFNDMIFYLNMHGTMWFFAFFCFFEAVFMIFLLPETKGKSNDEIVKLLSA